MQALLLPTFSDFLTKMKVWKLFIKKVFRGGTCPPELKTLGRKIAHDCRGLPLSIVVLGGLLANKEKTPRTWSKLIGKVNWYLTEANTICKDILALSYTDLPLRLKPCFLYFGLYPEDYEIGVRQLIHLWTAEGFIQHTGNRSVEDVAEDYLEELIDRSLIQVARRKTDGSVKTCRIHDLLRDLCIYESKEDKFLELLRDDIHSFTNKSRRVSLHGDSSFPLYIVPNFPDPPCARSLFFFGDNKDEYRYLFIEKFKLIRVLNFECSILKGLPKSISFHKSIETMIHLRYLRIDLSNPDWVIPDSIGNLVNLETLFVKGSRLGCDHSVTGIFKLQCLRNLYLKMILLLPYHLDEALWNLQVLSTAILCFDGEETFPVALNKFPCVRELGIQYISKRNFNFEGESKAEDYLKGLRHLRYLQILSIEHFPMLPNDLNSFPLTITKLTLYKVRLRVGGGMTVLANLPNLRILKIKWCTDIIDLQIFGDSFPQLQVLKLQWLEQVKEWKQERSAMPCLRYLVIKYCEYLTMLPPELWSLPALQKVEVLQPNSELARMLQELEMKVSCILRWSMGIIEASRMQMELQNWLHGQQEVDS